MILMAFVFFRKLLRGADGSGYLRPSFKKAMTST